MKPLFSRLISGLRLTVPRLGSPTTPSWHFLPINPEMVDSPVLSLRMNLMLRMQEAGLIEKLLAAGVVEKRTEDLKFSDDFCKHLVYCNRNYGFKGGGTLEIWRQIMVKFKSGLDGLSDKEIATTIVLLDYFLDRITTEKS